MVNKKVLIFSAFGFLGLVASSPKGREKIQKGIAALIHCFQLKDDQGLNDRMIENSEEPIFPRQQA